MAKQHSQSRMTLILEVIAIAAVVWAASVLVFGNQAVFHLRPGDVLAPFPFVKELQGIVFLIAYTTPFLAIYDLSTPNGRSDPKLAGMAPYMWDLLIMAGSIGVGLIMNATHPGNFFGLSGLPLLPIFLVTLPGLIVFALLLIAVICRAKAARVAPADAKKYLTHAVHLGLVTCCAIAYAFYFLVTLERPSE
jgi:hypothetical protein